ncbi:MerR family transcriptional regulator [Curvibacter sp. RS43]|uniref:MerR family transcriptional regulator n=1 Tax=Curvibacter microcysteis TaxID=3026419 RepID=UPI00236120D8|nr:MerR family transcriptional regulator [Curvibacter sp. RS43]MDD0812690.1 MerR family transcriptional regulator [Curvibacter sp. RS43]
MNPAAPSPPQSPLLEAELLTDDAFDLMALAHACRQSPDWVRLHVETGVLQIDSSGPEWRFSSQSFVRARRIAHLEATFDADPQLAALTVDLIEEVGHLRRQLLHGQSLPGDVQN